MNKTKYPISKIRSGEVAVKLTSIEQFKKIAPEQENVINHYIKNLYHVFQGSLKMLTWISNVYANSPACEEILIDFTQIDWEEGKEFKEPILHEANDERVLVNGFPLPIPFRIVAEDNYRVLQKQLEKLNEEKEELRGDVMYWQSIYKNLVDNDNTSTLKSENERLKEESEKLKSENEEVYRQLKLREFPKTSQPKELTLKQRMAWELYVSGFTHGIADKWTIAECYRSANIFLNYKGGENE